MGVGGRNRKKRSPMDPCDKDGAVATYITFRMSLNVMDAESGEFSLLFLCEVGYEAALKKKRWIVAKSASLETQKRSMKIDPIHARSLSGSLFGATFGRKNKNYFCERRLSGCRPTAKSCQKIS